MRVQEIATGLWRWTGLHPAWTPADGGPDGWEQEVGCYFYEGPGSIVLFDPLVPMEDRDRFLEALDRDVERAAGSVRILLTVEAHRRSAAELVERYAATVDEMPADVELVLDRWDERAYWVSEHSALVLGDVVISRGPELEIPRSWVGEEHYLEVIEGLLPLLELPIQRVLVTHGEPVLENGRAALAAALRS